MTRPDSLHAPADPSPKDWILSDVLPPQFIAAGGRGWELGALGGHALRVAAYTYIIARSYGLHERVCERLRRIAAFHDIGKMLLPPALLTKAGALTPQERRDIESHTVLGYELLLASNQPTLREAAIVAFCHHERMDGQGYPRKRHAAEIPLGARVVSVADVFDALTSDRSYRPALSEAQALEVVRHGSGAQFDPEVVAAFLQAFEAYPGLGRRIRWITAAQDAPALPVTLPVAAPALLARTCEDVLAADEGVAGEFAADRFIADNVVADKSITDRSIADRLVADRAVADTVRAEGTRADEDTWLEDWPGDEWHSGEAGWSGWR